MKTSELELGRLYRPAPMSHVWMTHGDKETSLLGPRDCFLSLGDGLVLGSSSVGRLLGLFGGTDDGEPEFEEVE